MSVFYYSTKLGNAYVVGCGKCEIAKFWFAKDGASHSPLTEEEASRIAKKLVEFLDTTVPSESLDEKEYGDSNKYLMALKLMNKISETHYESNEEEEEEEEDDGDETPSFEDFMKMMLTASMID